MTLIDLSIQFLKHLEIKYYLIFGLGYLTGWFLTWKVLLFFIVIGAVLLYSSAIHSRNTQQSVTPQLSQSK